MSTYNGSRRYYKRNKKYQKMFGFSTPDKARTQQQEEYSIEQKTVKITSNQVTNKIESFGKVYKNIYTWIYKIQEKARQAKFDENFNYIQEEEDEDIDTYGRDAIVGRHVVFILK